MSHSCLLRMDFPKRHIQPGNSAASTTPAIHRFPFTSPISRMTSEDEGGSPTSDFAMTYGIESTSRSVCPSPCASHRTASSDILITKLFTDDLTLIQRNCHSAAQSHNMLLQWNKELPRRNSEQLIRMCDSEYQNGQHRHTHTPRSRTLLGECHTPPIVENENSLPQNSLSENHAGSSNRHAVHRPQHPEFSSSRLPASLPRRCNGSDMDEEATSSRRTVNSHGSIKSATSAKAATTLHCFFDEALTPKSHKIVRGFNILSSPSPVSTTAEREAIFSPLSLGPYRDISRKTSFISPYSSRWPGFHATLLTTASGSRSGLISTSLQPPGASKEQSAPLASTSASWKKLILPLPTSHMWKKSKQTRPTFLDKSSIFRWPLFRQPNANSNNVGSRNSKGNNFPITIPPIHQPTVTSCSPNIVNFKHQQQQKRQHANYDSPNLDQYDYDDKLEYTDTLIPRQINQERALTPPLSTGTIRTKSLLTVSRERFQEMEGETETETKPVKFHVNQDNSPIANPANENDPCIPSNFQKELTVRLSRSRSFPLIGTNISLKKLYPWILDSPISDTCDLMKDSPVGTLPTDGPRLSDVSRSSFMPMPTFPCLGHRHSTASLPDIKTLMNSRDTGGVLSRDASIPLKLEELAGNGRDEGYVKDEEQVNKVSGLNVNNIGTFGLTCKESSVPSYSSLLLSESKLNLAGELSNLLPENFSPVNAVGLPSGETRTPQLHGYEDAADMSVSAVHFDTSDELDITYCGGLDNKNDLHASDSLEGVPDLTRSTNDSLVNIAGKSSGATPVTSTKYTSGKVSRREIFWSVFRKKFNAENRSSYKRQTFDLSGDSVPLPATLIPSVNVSPPPPLSSLSVTNPLTALSQPPLPPLPNSEFEHQRDPVDRMVNPHNHDHGYLDHTVKEMLVPNSTQFDQFTQQQQQQQSIVDYPCNPLIDRPFKRDLEPRIEYLETLLEEECDSDTGHESLRLSSSPNCPTQENPKCCESEPFHPHDSAYQVGADEQDTFSMDDEDNKENLLHSCQTSLPATSFDHKEECFDTAADSLGDLEEYDGSDDDTAEGTVQHSTMDNGYDELDDLNTHQHSISDPERSQYSYDNHQSNNSKAWPNSISSSQFDIPLDKPECFCPTCTVKFSHDTGDNCSVPRVSGIDTEGTRDSEPIIHNDKLPSINQAGNVDSNPSPPPPPSHHHQNINDHETSHQNNSLNHSSSVTPAIHLPCPCALHLRHYPQMGNHCPMCSFHPFIPSYLPCAGPVPCHPPVPASTSAPTAVTTPTVTAPSTTLGSVSNSVAATAKSKSGDHVCGSGVLPCPIAHNSILSSHDQIDSRRCCQAAAAAATAGIYGFISPNYYTPPPPPPPTSFYPMMHHHHHHPPYQLFYANNTQNPLATNTFGPGASTFDIPMSIPVPIFSPYDPRTLGNCASHNASNVPGSRCCKCSECSFLTPRPETRNTTRSQRVSFKTDDDCHYTSCCDDDDDEDDDGDSDEEYCQHNDDDNDDGDDEASDYEDYKVRTRSPHNSLNRCKTINSLLRRTIFKATADASRSAFRDCFKTSP